MSSFLSNIIHRHMGAETGLSPKLKGVFEPRKTPGRPNIPAPWQGNAGSDTGDAPNDENGLHDGSMMGDIQKISVHDVGKVGTETGKPVFPTSLNPIEQKRGMAQSPNFFRDNGHFFPTQKAIAPTHPMQAIQQRMVERVRLEVPKEEKSSTVFSSGAPNFMGRVNAEGANRQAEQAIKPVLKGQASFGQETAPWPLVSESNSPHPLNRVIPKVNGALAPYQDKQRDQAASRPSVSPPAIKVHIGRIEIKAVKEAPAKQAKPQMHEKRLTLDEFLKTRDNRLP